MKKPLLINIRLQFVTVSAPVCQELILITNHHTVLFYQLPDLLIHTRTRLRTDSSSIDTLRLTYSLRFESAHLGWTSC